MPRPLRYDERLDRYPPILVRLLARRGRGRETWYPDDASLAAVCGLSIARFKFIEWSTDWRDITNGDRRAYFMGCDVNLENRATLKRLEYMRVRGNFTWLHKSPLWGPQFREMVEVYVESLPA